MSHPATAHNPFLLMISPEVVLAAVEKSERLSQLNRHLCRPLDRATPAGADQTSPGEQSLAGDDSGED